MIEIKDLLDRFKSILLSEEAKKETISRVVSEVIGKEVASKDITIKNNVLYIRIKPIYKSEIFLKKERICARLKEIFDEKAPREIR
jgi:hypothetical protein